MAEISLDARQRLLEIARRSIEEAVEGRRHRPQKPEDPALLEPAGAFVTLRLEGMLRGCIGTFESSTPLYRTVADMARAAALEDPRFPPLRQEEQADVDLEISVLSPLKKLDDPSQVSVGVHGLYIVKGPCRGVLLPQVATEQGWDRVRFLEETCRKAGLPRDAWEKGAEICVFTAAVFGEKESG